MFSQVGSGHLLLLFPAKCEGTGSELEMLGLQSMPTSDAGITGSGFTCCTTIGAPNLNF